MLGKGGKSPVLVGKGSAAGVNPLTLEEAKEEGS